MIRGHIGMLTFLLDSPTTFDAVAEVLRKAPRVLLGTATMGKTTAELGAYFSDKGRQRGDWPEVFIWEESLQVRERVVHLIMAVHMESIVIPDTIDCLRAVSGGDPSVQNCMWQTDAALRIAKTHECYEELSL
jgi:glyceraldehyde-3-phosphate dehydrogenase (NAD(P))